jgi:hypothetical protein
LLACTPAPSDSGTNSGTGGSSSSNSGGSSGSGGNSSSGSGGSSSSTGGSPGSGGSSSSTGGSSGSGGSSSEGGSTGSGGSASGSGGSSGGTGGSGSTDAGGGGDTGGTPGGGSPAAALHNLVVSVPCPSPTTGGSCTVATNIRAYDKPIMIGGTAGTTYKVKLKVCAVYEGRPYSNCMMSPDSPRICINGTPGTGGYAPTYPTLGIKVDATKTYFLNAGNDYADKILKFDYTATFEMKGGSTINIISDGGNNGGIYTPFQGGAKYTCPDVPGQMAGMPFSGQFVHFQVVSVDPMN